MKTIGILAKVQVLLGVVLAGYCLFFSVGKIVEQESAIGKNLVECSKTIDNHRNFLDVSAGNFFKINSSVSKVANGCQVLANNLRPVPYLKVVSPYLLNIYDALKEQYQLFLQSISFFFERVVGSGEGKEYRSRRSAFFVKKKVFPFPV